MDSDALRLADDSDSRPRHSETRKRSGGRNLRPRHLHSRQLHTAAIHHSGNAEERRAVSSQGRVDVHPGAAARRARQEFSGRIIFHG